MSIMGKMVRIPAGNTTNEHYNFVVAKPLVFINLFDLICKLIGYNEYFQPYQAFNVYNNLYLHLH